jgi:hypothetical protein
MNYYHITTEETAKIILTEGLKANEDGMIFLFENKSVKFNNIINTVADCIARNQIFLETYVMLEIDVKGVILPLIPDNVSELSAKVQWIANQPLIEPKYITFFGLYKTDFTNTVKIE